MQKDVALIRVAAQSLGVAAPVADVASLALDHAVAAGKSGDDCVVFIRGDLVAAG